MDDTRIEAVVEPETGVSVTVRIEAEVKIESAIIPETWADAYVRVES